MLVMDMSSRFLYDALFSVGYHVMFSIQWCIMLARSQVT